MKKIILIITLLFITSCWNNIENKEKVIIEKESEKILKLENERWILWEYKKNYVKSLIDETKISDLICMWDYIYEEKYKIKNDIDFSKYKYVHRIWLLYRKEYSSFDITEFNIDNRDTHFWLWCTWDFLIKWKFIYKNINKEEIIKKYEEHKKDKKEGEIKKYNYEKLVDVFAISRKFCQWDILYKWERYKNEKDYSSYSFWMFAPTKEQQKKYDELTKYKIYWKENSLDFLAKYDMYCLWDFYDGSDLFYNNFLKQKLFDRYYNENKEAKKIKNILSKDLDNWEEITLDELRYINTFYKKFPNFLSEIRYINSLSYIYTNLNTVDKKKYFLKILNNILISNKNSYTFALILNFYIDNLLLEDNKKSLLKNLEKWFGFDEENYYWWNLWQGNFYSWGNIKLVKDYINNPEKYTNKRNMFLKIK